MQTLSFSHNHNGKLLLNSFGTVRLHNPSKYGVGKTLEVDLNKLSLGIVAVAAVRTFRFKQISDVLAYLDCGKPARSLADMMRRMYSKGIDLNAETQFDHVVLYYLKRNMDSHAILFADFWKEKVAQHPNTPIQQLTFNY